MLIIVKILFAATVWYVLPQLLGQLWKSKETYLLGILTEWGIFYCLAKIAIATDMSLHELCRVWLIVMGALTVAALIFCVWTKRIHVWTTGWKTSFKKKIPTGIALLLLCAVTLVCNGSRQQDMVIEDALTMYATDTLYKYEASSGRSEVEMLPYETQCLTQDSAAPVEAYYAVNSKVYAIHPAKLICILLPFFLLPFYFEVYRLWAEELFREDKKKQISFQMIVWLLYATTLIADRSSIINIFANCQSGETLFFCGLLPIAVWFLLRSCSRFKYAAYYVVCMLAGQLLYERGAFVITFLWIMACVSNSVRGWKDDSRI